MFCAGNACVCSRLRMQLSQNVSRGLLRRGGRERVYVRCYFGSIILRLLRGSESYRKTKCMENRVKLLLAT